MPAKIFGDRDHAYCVAEAVAQYFKAPMAPEFLERVNFDEQKTKDLQQRGTIKMKLRGNFAEHDQDDRGLWLLIDDVVTTGSTLITAWNLLGKPKAIGLTLVSTPLRRFE